MKKLVMLLMASLLVASTAFAVVDEDSDMVGFYFDTTADTACLEGVTAYSTLPAYLILTNPSYDALYGFEVGYNLVGNGMVLSTIFANPLALDVGSAANHIVGFGEPTMTEAATVLATLSLMYMDTTLGPLAFNLTGSNPSSMDDGLPCVLLADGIIESTGFSTLDGTTAAIINGVCEDVVATEPASFGAVKSLYR